MLNFFIDLYKTFCSLKFITFEPPKWKTIKLDNYFCHVPPYAVVFQMNGYLINRVLT